MPEISTPELQQLHTLVDSNVESLGTQHFDYLLVFGQGPVQESGNIPNGGRDGLNIYSRLLALAAAQTLKDGIVDKLILSGGQTGIKAGQPDAKSEADLMADVIRRYLVTPHDRFIEANGKQIARYAKDGKLKTMSQIDEELAEAFRNRICIENKSRDTLENFINITHTYFDPTNPELSKKKVALLGMAFHALDTHSGAGVGRLERLGQIFQLDAPVFSAEGMLRKLIISAENKSEGARNILENLTDTTLSHVVTRLKSRQEKILVEMLNTGDWLRLANNLKNNEPLLRKMTLGDPNVMGLLQSAKNISLKEAEAYVHTCDLTDLIGELGDIYNNPVRSRLGETYSRVKGGVFRALELLSKKTETPYYDTRIFRLFGKGEDPRKKE